MKHIIEIGQKAAEDCKSAIPRFDPGRGLFNSLAGQEIAPPEASVPAVEKAPVILPSSCPYPAAGKTATTPQELRLRFPKEFRAWRAMRKRCANPKSKYYGAAGVRVCAAWQNSFAAFLQNLGPAPSFQHSLDRYPDAHGNYGPGNVRWATSTEQQHNTVKCRWLSLNGRMLCLEDWSKETSIAATTIAQRIASGWTVEQALTTPPEPSRTTPRRYVAYRGQYRPVAEWARIVGLSVGTLAWRLGRGWSVERAMETPGRRKAG